jgi:hypothetical protein
MQTGIGEETQSEHRTSPFREGGGKGEQKEVLELIEHTDRVAGIHNSLRAGTEVVPGKTDAVSIYDAPRPRD